MTDNETRLLNERLARLTRFIEINASIVLIGDECKLVLRSLHNNSKWRMIYCLFYESIHYSFHKRFVDPILYTLCRLNIYHVKDSDGDCYFCVPLDNP